MSRLNERWVALNGEKIVQVLIIAVGNDEKWMPEDGYNEGLENIGKGQLCDEEHMSESESPNFTKMILKKNKSWSNLYDLGTLFRKVDPKILIYMKNSGKYLIRKNKNKKVNLR